MSSCVVGVGNRLRGDDAVGLEVARLLHDTVPPGVDVLECEGEPVRLLDLWHECARTIVVDAMKSGAEPGTIRRVAAHNGPLPPELHGPSTHLLGLSEAIELARALHRLPEQTIVYAIEGTDFDAGEQLSAPVAAAVFVVAASIRRELEELR